MISVANLSSIQRLEAKNGISMQNGRGPTVMIANDGVLDLQAGDNITLEELDEQVFRINGQAIDSSIAELLSGEGIVVQELSPNNYKIYNTGVTGLESGLNTTIDHIGGSYQVNAVGGVLSIQTNPGLGLEIANPSGPNVTVTNTGVLTVSSGLGTSITNTNQNVTLINEGAISLQAGSGVTINSDEFGTWSVNTKGPLATIENPLVLTVQSSTNILEGVAKGQDQQFNPIVGSGVDILAATGASNSKTLSVTCFDNECSGIRINSNGVVCGVGGTSSTPASSINVTSNNLSLKAQTVSLIARDDITLFRSLQNVIQFEDVTTFTKIPSYSSSITVDDIEDDSSDVPSMNWVHNVVSAKNIYVKKYTQNFSYIDIPTNCVYVDIVLISQGGLAGSSATSSTNVLYSGGSGQGGTIAILKHMMVREEQFFYFNFTDSFDDVLGGVTLSYSETKTPNPSHSSSNTTAIASLTAGGNGGNASVGSPGSAGKQPSAYIAFTNGDYGTWKILKGVNGLTGEVYEYPASAGYPLGRAYWEGESGVGQAAPASAKGGCALYLTYFIL